MFHNESGKHAARVTQVPKCFQPLQHLRTGPTYENLSEHTFVRLEKLFACQQIRNENPENFLIEPTKVTAKGKQKVAVDGFAKRHKLCESTVKGWLSRYDQGLRLHDGTPGKPCFVKDESVIQEDTIGSYGSCYESSSKCTQSSDAGWRQCDYQ